MARKPNVPDNSFGYSIFCDDIRRELGNKNSYMGVYVGDLNIDAPLPTAMPKFCIAAFFYLNTKHHPKEMSLKVFLPGDVEEASISMPLNLAPLPPMLPDSPDGEFSIVRADLILSPLAIPAAGAIEVRVYRDGKEDRIGMLRVNGLAGAPTVAVVA